jgi:hypothetical protein
MRMSKALVCTLLSAFTTVTLAAETARPEAREKAVMLYFTKSFGSDQKRNRTPLAFGIKLQQSAPFGATRPIALLDARYSLSGRKTFALAGLNLDSATGSSDESSTSSTTSSATLSHEHPGWTVAMIALAVLGTACATETLLCESGGRRSTSESPGLGND